MSQDSEVPRFQTVELYIFADRRAQLCMRLSSGDAQEPYVVLDTEETHLLNKFIAAVAHRGVLEGVVHGLRGVEERHGEEP